MYAWAEHDESPTRDGDDEAMVEEEPAAPAEPRCGDEESSSAPSPVCRLFEAEEDAVPLGMAAETVAGISNSQATEAEVEEMDEEAEEAEGAEEDEVEEEVVKEEKVEKKNKEQRKRKRKCLFLLLLFFCSGVISRANWLWTRTRTTTAPTCQMARNPHLNTGLDHLSCPSQSPYRQPMPTPGGQGTSKKKKTIKGLTYAHVSVYWCS